MVVKWMVAPLLLALLAGCSGPDPNAEPAGPEQTSFEDLEVEATATTGIIRGVVVDDRITPIKDAAVSVTGADVNRSAVSDAEGRFAFADLTPGTYFLRVSSLLHSDAQTSVDVQAGDDNPKITKVQLTRRFSQEAFVEALKHDGFIQCNQAGVVYATAPCVTDFSSLAIGYVPAAQRPCMPGVRCCTAGGCFPELRRVQAEERGFTQELGPGWQTLIWEMHWEETSATFSQMGVTVSYNETERCACHNFASRGSPSPFRLQIDVGVDHETSADNEPDLIPEQGLPAMYYFVGVRSGPALAVNQQFVLFAHFFHYGTPPEGWSFLAGDQSPF